MIEYSSQVVAAHSPKLKFQQWFPSYGYLLNGTLHAKCAQEYEFYLSHDGAQGCLGCNIEPAISCLIQKTAGYNNANMQSAQVLLGLLPSMLALAACTSAEIGVLALRRPLLAFLIATASPAANPIRTAEFENPTGILQWRPQIYSPSGPLGRRALALIQYILVLAAMVNLASLCWDLGLGTVLAWAPNSVVYPGAWALLAIAIHLFGAAAVSLRVRLIENIPNLRPPFKRWTMQEFQLSSSQATATLTVRPENSTSLLFVPMSWLASTGTLAHIIFGVFTFSAMLFIGFGDALVVVIRLMASVVLCRIILVYELSGLRRRVKMDKGWKVESELQSS